MGDYDFKPSGSLKLKGVKDKKIKKSKKEKSSQPKKDEETASADKESGSKSEPFVVPMTEAERRFEEIQRQRMEKRIEKSALKSHRERVDEMNQFLDSLSDVWFVRKSGLMGSIMICLKSGLAKEVMSVEIGGEE
jgi:protein FAM32A